MNMSWESDGFTVYAINEEGVNDFSFHVQGNGRSGHDPKTLEKVVNMAKASPDMYNALKGLLEAHRHVYGLDGAWDSELKAAEAALAKADGEA